MSAVALIVETALVAGVAGFLLGLTHPRRPTSSERIYEEEPLTRMGLPSTQARVIARTPWGPIVAHEWHARVIARAHGVPWRLVRDAFETREK